MVCGHSPKPRVHKHVYESNVTSHLNLTWKQIRHPYENNIKAPVLSHVTHVVFVSVHVFALGPQIEHDMRMI